MRKLLALGLLLVLSAVLAAPVAPPNGTAGLYYRTIGGDFQFACSAFKVELASHQRVYGHDPLITSAHCLRQFSESKQLDMAAWVYESLYATFNDGRVFIQVLPSLQGNRLLGYDFGVLRPHVNEGDSWKRVYDSVPTYRMSTRTSVDFDEEVFNWAYPAGLDMAYVRGRVTNPDVTRPILDAGRSLNWVGYFAVDMMCTGGCSGSPVFDRNGEVIGIVTGSISNGRSYRQMYVLPVWKFYRP
jgi:hypothetical protein